MSGQSPSRLGKKPRRLNVVPLVMVGGVVATFSGILVYTMIQRADRQAKQVAASTESQAPTPAKAPSFISATAAEVPIKIPPHTPPAATAAPVIVQPDTGSTMPDPRILAWQNYYQELARVQQAKADANTKAMEADTSAEGAGFHAPGLSGGPGGASPPATSLASLTGGVPSLGGDDVPPAGTDAGSQAEKRAFLAQKGDTLGLNEDLAALKHDAKTDTIMEGTAIQAVMVVGSTSDMPGMMKAQVTRSVYDSMTGDDVLIPQGAYLIGKNDNSVSAGQTREGVIWQRIIFPDSSSIQLGSMEGADQAGYAGLHDQVNTHFWNKFGSALLISIAGTGAQLAQPQQSAFSGYSPGSMATGQLTQQFSQLGQEYAKQGLSIPNTLTIRPGYQLVVMANKDIHLPPYVDARTNPAPMMAAGPVMR